MSRLFSARTVLLRVIPVLTLVLVNVLFLAMLDSLFAMQKRAVIIDAKDRFIEFDEQLEPIKRPLLRLINQYQNMPDVYMENALEFLEENADEFLRGDHPWFRITLDDENNQRMAEYENLAKKREFNNASTSLFSRTFEAPAAFPAIYLTVYYATPNGWPTIEAMVLRYWVYALLFIGSSLLVYWWLDRRVILPLQRVGRSIETMIQPGQVALIDRPLEDIELACNRLARVQREVYFGLRVEDIVDELQALSDDHEVLETFLSEVTDVIHEIYHIESISTFLQAGDEKAFVFHSGDPAHRKAPAWPHNHAPLFEDTGAIVIPLVPGDQITGCIRLNEAKGSTTNDERESIALEIQKQCAIGLARAMTRSQALTEERNRFGINLATNMGHDLTNIIATSKWDMNTIQRALKAGIIQVDDKRGAFFQESVDGLKNNLSFLQEMVDIYRSFGSIRRPNFDTVDLGELAEETGRLFQLSSSQKFDLQVDTPEGLKRILEPRLFRMALFNLLSNAVQAVRRSDMPIEDTRIRVTAHTGDEDTVILTVCDNGPGIRNPDGTPMPPETIPRIFQSGYTTKDVDSGGGLGLAWVKSIIEDYHQGRIDAQNMPDGGACFTITLPHITEIPDGKPEAPPAD